MNFQLMSKQRKFLLISSAVGFISMFLPWVSISMFGYTQSANGMHKEGVVVFICFVVTGIIAFIDDQKKNLDKTMWTVTLLAGVIALLFIILVLFRNYKFDSWLRIGRFWNLCCRYCRYRNSCFRISIKITN